MGIGSNAKCWLGMDNFDAGNRPWDRPRAKLLPSQLASTARRFLWLAIVALLAPSTPAEEGMWLYDHLPFQTLREKYSFQPSDDWLEHLQKSSVHFGGGSGEFVSEDGLILSNQHVGSRAIHKLSTQSQDYTRNGFYARTLAEEKPCAGLEVSVLISTEDVTAQVNAAVPPGSTDEAAFKARRAAIAAIEKTCLEQTGLRGSVVTLYQGSEYHLYRSKRYTDVRLVFAPEEQIGFFGGDADNFEFPRHDLDISLFRAYENGHPAHVDHYLKWSKTGVAANDLVFVSGHPGRTDRLRTLAELEYLRDIEYPRTLERLKRLEVLFTSYGQRSVENWRRARSDLRGAQNTRKVREGTLAGLLDPELLGRKVAAERQLREAVANRADLVALGTAWDRIARAQKEIALHAQAYELLEIGTGFNSSLFGFARQLLRASEERLKPNGDRLEEYRDSALPSLELGLVASQPIYPDLEILKLTDSLTYLVEKLGWTNSLVTALMNGESPRKRASLAVQGSQLANAAKRRELYQGGQNVLKSCADPMLTLARDVDAAAREVRKIVEVQREAIRQAHAQIGIARYALFGSSQYPDATSSLRLAFGTVSGYREDARDVPFQTTFAGLYQRAAEHQFRSPFDLPDQWVKRRKHLNLSTPLNFICTADIIGGNSGSPVVNRDGEFVGVIFDGNLQSLVAGIIYTDVQARALAVNSQAIIESLRKIYRAVPLADELRGKTRPVSGRSSR